MNQKFNKCIDEYQNVHIQDKVLGQGGQGVVFRTEDPDLAIKLVTYESGDPVTDEESVKRYSKRFKRVRLLPLPEDLNISVPAALLQNNAGYVMQLLSEMVPFSHFYPDDKSCGNIDSKDIPIWLSAMREDEAKEKEAKKIVYYYKTGGLRRRLQALYKCASLLARLHGGGMVYGDISLNNIFVSKECDGSSVWLIDADNIRFEVDGKGSAVYTPRYGAPELVREEQGGSAASDCHAFAVVAFYLLSLSHPFIGKKVDGTDEGDWADDENDEEDIEEQAYKGLLPWIDDEHDDTNSSESGLPRALLLTEELRLLFEKTFGIGRKSPSLRPTIYHWPAALAQAADMTVICPNCKMSYYYDYIDSEKETHSCPYCDEPRPALLTLQSYYWHGKNNPLKEPCWRYIRETSNNLQLTIPKRVFGDFTTLDADEEELSISLSEKSILIKKSDYSKNDLYVAIDNHQPNKFQQFYSQIKIDWKLSNVQFWILARSEGCRLVHCTINGDKK